MTCSGGHSTVSGIRGPDVRLSADQLAVYDLPAEVLDTLSLKTDAEVQDGAQYDRTDETTGSSRSTSPGSENVVGSQACSLCSLSFATVQEQRSHLKSDLHHYNLKQKLRGQNPVSEAEFEKLIGSAYYISVLTLYLANVSRSRRKPVRFRLERI